MSSFTAMIIPTDRPVSWREYIASQSGCPPIPEVVEALLDDNDRILTAAAETLCVAPSEIYAAASAARIEWMSPFTPGRTDPVYARLSSGPWVLQPGVRNGTPPLPDFARKGLHRAPGIPSASRHLPDSPNANQGHFLACMDHPVRPAA